ncbi:MAG TPA: helix-turn-helix domain-containing protein [Candidatus Kryptonia bacterium]|nr:helix-turn-helix domain-containing protein [Candidatus Kryptonia bacterium]
MTPKPGKPVRGSRTGRPIMALLDLLGRRWSLRILWELQHGALSFADLRDRCDAMSPSVLNQRLAELREAGVIGLRDEGGYVVTADGRGLCASLAPLQHWAERWAQRGRPAARPAKARRIAR